ncbi:MAG: hypothetical protein K8U03_14530 [Planctomycetia bacterium]|nr:hypothetical protein [Planctomycetia bacterium]
MPVSPRRCFSFAREHCLAMAVGFALVVVSVSGPFVEVAAAQEAAVDAAPKIMTQGVKADGSTPADVTKLMENPKLATQLRALVIPILNQGKAASQQETDNVDTWTIYRISELTWPPKDAKDTPEQRRMLLKSRELLKLSGTAPLPDLHDRINATLLANLPAMIADKEYSLGVRYNAMLLLGQLDRIEPDGVTQRAAAPLDAAEPILIGASQSTQLPEVLRVGAFIGLARHTELQLGGANRPAIAAEALKYLTATALPAGISQNGLHWLRKLSMQIVMGLSTKGSDVNRPEFVKALQAILADEKQPLFLRRDAALAIGHMDPNTIAAGAKPEDVVKALTNLTLAITKAGSPRENPEAIADLTKPEDVLQTPTEENKKAFADAVAYYLNCIATGLGGRNEARGLLKIATGETKTQATTLLNTYVNPMVTALGRSNATPEKLVNDLVAQHTKLSTWAGQNKLAAPPPNAVDLNQPPGGRTTSVTPR